MTDQQMTPAILAARVAEIIRSKTGLWHQAFWIGGPLAVNGIPVERVAALLDGADPKCGTTCCVAGWTVVLAAPRGSQLERFYDGEGEAEDELTVIRTPDNKRHFIVDYAARALGLTLREGSHPLFDSHQSYLGVLAILGNIAARGVPGDR